MRVLMMAVALLLGNAQQGPPRIDKLPPSNEVKDRARPDFGYMRPWAGTVVTVIVVYSADCQACDASVPFYKRLATAPGMDRKTGRFVVLTEGGIAPVSFKIEGHPDGFRPDVAASYPDDDRFAVKEYPTLLILDGAWKKRGEWRGRLSSDQERAALELITAIQRESKGRAK
jgi:hypothetical protein